MGNASNLISLGALIVSLLSVGFTVYWNSPIGEVGPLEPSGYAVIRGMGVEGGIGPLPSDHLVFPMQWKNASGRPIVIQKPELILCRPERKETKAEEDQNKEGKEELIFTLAGTYPDISTDSFSKRYSHNNSFLVGPHSVLVITMVFHIKGFAEDNAYFQFASTDEFRVLVKYVKNSGLGSISQKISTSLADGERKVVLAKSLKMHGSLDDLKTQEAPERKKTDPWWDYWEELTF